jgi:hypothetical protein
VKSGEIFSSLAETPAVQSGARKVLPISVAFQRIGIETTGQRSDKPQVGAKGAIDLRPDCPLLKGCARPDPGL